MDIVWEVSVCVNVGVCVLCGSGFVAVAVCV